MKPEGAAFDRMWRRSCTVAPVNRKQIGGLVNQHYLHEWPRDIQLAFGLKRRGKLLGVVTYSSVVNELKTRFGDQVWELSRLVVADRVPTNAESFFIGATIRYIKRHYGAIERLISFADPKYGHRGTVYKAANWTQVEHGSKNLFVYELKSRTHAQPLRDNH